MYEICKRCFVRFSSSIFKAIFKEFAKSRAWRALRGYVLACSRAWRVCVLCACVLGMFACFPCLGAWDALVFDVLAYSRAWRAFVFACFPYVLAMKRAWRI